jgi:2-oxoglutarate ferredoxin oxidoreductase subunit alpha
LIDLKADPKAVRPGTYFIDGNHAACDGAIAAGCRFVAGYPITPSTEVVERFAERIPMVGGIFRQMEDELASSIMIQGAVWAGAKAMTVTSGPGFSLMQEHIGLAAMTETPCVFVNVQRGGPSTGLPTLPAQADMMQARWGSHGDYEIIALSPSSPQECFDMIIDAFNLSEKYRVPVLFMMDEIVGHMTEKVIIPEADRIEVAPRRWTKKKQGAYLPFEPEKDGIPDIVKAGDGYRIHTTGLTHDERGYPVISPEMQEKQVGRIVRKIRENADNICRYESEEIEDTDVVVISYGITTRVAREAVRLAQDKGMNVGHVRLVVTWPFPESFIRKLAKKVKAIVVAEINYGQMKLEVERCAAGAAKVLLAGHGGGRVHAPEQILEKITEAAK